MDSDNNIKDVLLSLEPTFQKTAIELMTAMFGQKPEIHEPWVISETMNGAFDYIFSLISYGDEYKSNTIIGASMQALEAIFRKGVSLAEAKDAFGEFSNCYYAVLMDEPNFFETFGVLRQEPPEDATVLACFPVAWGIQGLLHIGNESIFLRFSMEKKKFGSEVLDSIDK